ncbi:MAG: sodium:calcium antiporter [Myxococcota bacterium]|nr:sodium:calcium antiporter [Myxococcota bacterium]
MVEFLLIVVGLFGLWVGTELALRHTIDLTERYGLSQGFVGLTVLAVGTDLPELMVAINGGIHQLQGIEASGVVVGNAVGSAITQGSLVLGVAGIVGHLRLARRLISRDGFVLVLATGLLALLGQDGQITRTEGGALLVVYALYYAMLFQAERGRPKAPESRGNGARIALGISGGMIAVLLSAEIVVDNALALAELWRWDQTVVGVFLVGAGTSLPELALSLGAAARGRTGLSVGNILGSNIFDLLVPVGVSAVIHPLSIQLETLFVDLPVLLLVILAGLAAFARNRGLHRPEAIGLIVIWTGYAVIRLGFFGGH